MVEEEFVEWGEKPKEELSVRALAREWEKKIAAAKNKEFLEKARLH